jgi:S-formylglutathione hydrolase FrmB
VTRAFGSALILAALLLGGRVYLNVESSNPKVVEVDVSSAMLTAFRHDPTQIRAQVLVPDSYAASPERRYPTIFWVHGFGGAYRFNPQSAGSWNDAMRAAGTEFIVVALDASIETGHHVFANSANNGSWGDALVREFVPALDRRFRTLATPQTRFLAGFSSGGWSVLWLQVNYPETFGGEWSLSPDPVDFHDFTGPDLWREPPQNLYRAPDGRPYWLVRRNGRDVETLRDYVQADDGRPPPQRQFGSFDAVFSPRGADGQPEKLFDHETGAIDPTVERYWDVHYDIAHLVEKRWPTLKPELRGKLHLIVGTEDTYHLEGSLHLFADELKHLGSDADVVFAPGYDHATIYEYDGGLIRHIVRQMAAMRER